MKDRMFGLKHRVMSVAVAAALAGCGAAEAASNEVNDVVGKLGGSLLEIDKEDLKCELPVFVLPRVPVDGQWADMADVVWHKRNKLAGDLGKVGQSVGTDVWAFLSEPDAQSNGLGYSLKVMHPNVFRSELSQGERDVFAYAFSLGGSKDCSNKTQLIENYLILEKPEWMSQMDQKSRNGMSLEEIENPPPPPGNSLPGEPLTPDEETALANGVLLRGLMLDVPSLVPASIMDPNNTGSIPGCEVYDATVPGNKTLYAPQGSATEVYDPKTKKIVKYECEFINNNHKWRQTR